MIDGFSGREIAKLAVAWQVCWILIVLTQWQHSSVCIVLDNSCKRKTRKFVSLLNCVSISSFPFGCFRFPCLFFLLRLIPSFSLFSLSLHKARAFGSVDGELTEEMMDNGVKEMVEQHQQKVFWEKGSSQVCFYRNKGTFIKSCFSGLTSFLCMLLYDMF